MSQCLIFNQQALIIVTDDGTIGSPLDQAIFTFSNYSGCIAQDYTNIRTYAKKPGFDSKSLF